MKDKQESIIKAASDAQHALAVLLDDNRYLANEKAPYWLQSMRNANAELSRTIHLAITQEIE